MGGKIFLRLLGVLFSKVCLQLPAMFCLISSSKLYLKYFEFSLKVKVMGLNPGYLLKSFLLYLLFVVYPKNIFIYIYLQKDLIIMICFSGWLSKPGRILDSHALSSFETKQYWSAWNFTPSFETGLSEATTIEKFQTNGYQTPGKPK